MTQADNETRDWDDPCNCPQDTEERHLCVHRQFVRDVEMAGGLTAYRIEQERQQMEDAGFPSWMA